MLVGQVPDGHGGCDLCGCEVVEAQKVVALMDAGYADEANWVARWHAYRPGMATAYSGRQVLTKVRFRQPVCPCRTVLGVPAKLVMIRERYRDAVRSYIGSAMTVPFLLSLPEHMVAWENASLVGVKVKDDEVVLAGDGLTLLSHIYSLATAGYFRTRVQLSEQDVLYGFSYLYMVKRRYRSIVAGDMGAAVALGKLFAEVPVAWFDWAGMLALYVDKFADGTLRVGRVPGLPLVDEVVRLMTPNKPTASPSVVSGSSVSRATTVVQFMPREDSDVRSFAHDRGRAHVLLDEGLSFLPMGPVAVRGYDVLMAVEPGVQLRTERGSVITGECGIAVVLNGSVSFSLELAGQAARDYEGDGYNPARDYSVAIVTENCRSGTALGKWRKRRFDALTTDARFFGGIADFVILSDPAYSDDPVVKPPCEQDMLPERMSGVVGRKKLYSAVKCGARLRLRAHMACYSAGDVVQSYILKLGGCVELHGGDVVGCVTDTYMSVAPQVDKLVWPSVSIGDMIAVEYEEYLIGDSYYIDGGGPSGSDGEYVDDTGTVTVDENQFAALDWFRKRIDAGLAVNSGVSWLEYSTFAALFVDPADAVHELGGRVGIESLLTMAEVHIDLRRLDTTGLLMQDYSGVSLVDVSRANCTWEQLVHSVVHWLSPTSSVSVIGRRVFYHALLDRYPGALSAPRIHRYVHLM